MAKKEYFAVGDGYIDITLSSETEIGGVKVKTLRMREPLVRDELAVGKIKDETEREPLLLGNLCGISPADMQVMTVRSYKRLVEAFLALTD